MKNPVRAVKDFFQDIAAFWDYVCYGQFGESKPEKPKRKGKGDGK